MYLRIQETNIIKQVEMKGQINERVSQTNEKLFETNVCSKNLIKNQGSYL